MNDKITVLNDHRFGVKFLNEFRSDPLGFYQDSVTDGDSMVYFKMLWANVFMLNHPDVVHEVLVTQADKFHKLDLQKNVLKGLVGNGLVNSEDDFWRRQRKLMQPAFHS